MLGWSKIVVPPLPHNTPKIKLVTKDKLFSLSSATSQVNLEFDDIIDKNLTPYPENRFQTMYLCWYLVKKGRIRKGNNLLKLKKELSGGGGDEYQYDSWLIVFFVIFVSFVFFCVFQGIMIFNSNYMEMWMSVLKKGNYIFIMK
jgi:hypothetical protein